MLLCKKIKLEVSAQDAATLEFMQGKCRGLYNWWIGRLRDGEKWPGWKKAKATLQESKQHDPELCSVYGKLLHEVYFRADKAMQAFFRRLSVGEKPGFPRFSPRHEFFTLCYPAMYIKVEGTKLLLPTGGKGEKNKKYPTIVATLTEIPPLAFLMMLTYKCQLYGKTLHFLDERNTSKMCSGCGHLQAMPLWKRTYCCTECGLVMDRDENSAVNILTRYVARLGPHTGDPVRCADVFTAITCLNTF